jgi:hypothetical protein
MGVSRTEQLDVIARLANKGIIGRELRSILKADHGWIFNRNQMGGVLFRLRESGRVTFPAISNKVAQAAASPSAPTLRSIGDAVRAKKPMPMSLPATVPSADAAPPPPREAAPPLPPVVLPSADAPSLSVNLFDLRSGCCRWPLWVEDDVPIAEKFFCGSPQRPESPYCAEHHRRSSSASYHPISVRNAGNVKKALVS